MRSRTKRRWWARSLVLSLAAAMAACSGPEKVRIIGECEVEGEATIEDPKEAARRTVRARD